MKCPICVQEVQPLDHQERWGPEFAHARCIIVFNAGSTVQDAKLQAYIKRLEEAGDELTNCIGCGCNDGGCKTCRESERKWEKAKEAKP